MMQNEDKSPIYAKIYPAYDYILKFDGASKGNPGLAGAGAVIYYQDEEKWADSSCIGTKCTNNQAEYAGLIMGLEKAKELEIDQLYVVGDSLLVINQMKGVYQCKSNNLWSFYEKARELSAQFTSIEFVHVLRHKNKRADQLANAAIQHYLSDVTL